MYCFLGMPKKEVIKSSHISRSLFNLNYDLTYEIHKDTVNKMKSHVNNLHFHCNSSTIKTLILGILTWDPKDRMSIDSCLKLF